MEDVFVAIILTLNRYCRLLMNKTSFIITVAVAVNERDNVTTCGVRIDFTISVEKASRNSQARMRLVDVDHVTTVT